MEISYQATDHDLTVLRGQIPIRELPSLMKRHGKDAIVDTWLARALKATMVIGSPEACARKREALGLSQLPRGMSPPCLWISRLTPGVGVVMWAHHRKPWPMC
ncbi:hypothetical protein [Halomonas sp. E19]|uniref:hypothetical protein n=1 Tax=Halomonas sp. E19 TaxID=3397247 RepID=UPI004034B1DE